MPAPAALLWALHEHVLGTNPAVWMYAGGAGFAQIFYHLGTEEQKKWAVLAAERGWGATMVLTRARRRFGRRRRPPKAVKREDGSWHIDGVKRFITSADSTTCSRTSCTWCWPAPRAPDPAPRACRCSSFPKYHFDPVTGEPGERNGAFVTNVEHRWAEVSATCELTFGQHGVPAKGWLVGDCTTASRRCSMSSSRPG